MNTLNQASEDKLDTVFYKYLGGTPDSDEYQDWLELKYAIESIIRTEKLKLLAEVRERVIGEDLPPDVATDSGIGYSRQQFAINMGKAGQRTKLTKLEAEL